MKEKNYYKILGVTEDASEKVIKRAYHKLARQYHPDKAENKDELAKFEEEFALVSKAYNTLKDKGKKAEYDKHLGKSDGQKNEEVPKQYLKTSSPPPKEQNPTSAATAQVNYQRKAEVAERAFKKGLILFKNRNYSASIEFFQAAINYNDEVATYHMKLAQAIVKSRKSLTKAIESAKKAIELDPWNIDYKFNLGEIYEEAGIYSLAQSTFKDILKWDASYTQAQEKLNGLKGKGKTGNSFFENLWKKLTTRKE